jgi:hypothetical protein
MYSQNDCLDKSEPIRYVFRPSVEEVGKHYIHPFVLGFTDGKKIVLREGLGYEKPFVLAHEIEHTLDMRASESVIDNRARSRLHMH